MEEVNKGGRPVDVEAVKEAKRVNSEFPTMSYREKAVILAKRLKREKIDPKAVWRWESYELQDVA